MPLTGLASEASEVQRGAAAFLQLLSLADASRVWGGADEPLWLPPLRTFGVSGRGGADRGVHGEKARPVRGALQVGLNGRGRRRGGGVNSCHCGVCQHSGYGYSPVGLG